MSPPNSKKTPLILALLVIWAFGGIAQYTYCCSGKDDKSLHGAGETHTHDNQKKLVSNSSTDDKKITAPVKSAETASLVGSIVAGLDAIKPDGNITFGLNKAVHNDIDNEVTQAFSIVPDFLSKNPDKALQVTGHYLDSETAPEGLDDLGLARAESVKSWLQAQQVESGRIITLSEKVDTLPGEVDTHRIATDFAIVDNPNIVTTTVEAENSIEDVAPLVTTNNVEEEAKLKAEEEAKLKVVEDNTVKLTQHAFMVKGEGIELEHADNFNFISGDSLPTQPISEVLDDNLMKVVDYLKANTARQLTVTGRYQSDEHNPSIFDSLGIARANQIREYLVFLGADSRQVALADQVDNAAIRNDKEQFFGMADFSVQTLDDSDKKDQMTSMQQLADKIRKNPLILYFKTGDVDISLSAEQRVKLANIISYLNYDATAKAVITGHTDNVGRRDGNVKLALERAQLASDQLKTKGLKREQMDLQSEGPDKPIANNGTRAGRAKNRRVEISISESN